MRHSNISILQTPSHAMVSNAMVSNAMAIKPWLLTMLILVVSQVLSPKTLPGKDRRPNIVLINLDDADRDMFRPEILEQRFPSIARIAKNGKVFTNFHVTTPLCGPSRACLLRGQYAHSINHRTNEEGGFRTRGFKGDFSSFVEQGYFDDDMGMWMKRAGYRTVFVGKYINSVAIKNRLPAGWDDFYQSKGSRYFETVRFTNRTNPKGRSEKIPSGIYRTVAETDDVVSLIESGAKQDKPLFVYFAPFGPHSEGRSPGGMIDPADKMKWTDIKQPVEEDFDEPDISDKPFPYQTIGRLTSQLKDRLQEDYRNRMLAVRSIDRAIERIVTALHENHLADNTYLFVTSDNGYSLGQHRMSGKGNSMSRSSHVPLIVSGPGIAAGETTNQLLAHIDLAPTFIDLAAGRPPVFVDGKSFAPLLFDSNEPATQWRNAVLIENWQSRMFMGRTINTTFCQLRMHNSIYTEWANGAREFYDLESDPLELNNRFSELSETRKKQLSCQLKQTRNPQTRPIVTMEQAYVNPESDSRLVLCGVAEDSTGIVAVELLVRAKDTGLFWNGQSWQLEPFRLIAEISNPDGIQSEWKCDSGLGADLIQQLTVTPISYSRNGNRSRPVFLEPTLDSSPPLTFIQRVGLPDNGHVRVVGRARDNHQVAGVRIHLQNLDNGMYFNGRQWVPDCECIQCRTQSNRWEVYFPKLKNGHYMVRANAFDTRGNSDPSGEEREFHIKR